MIWPRGYPSEDGMKHIVVTDKADANLEAVLAFGPLSTVSRIVRPRPPAAPVSNAAAAAYTRNDNS